MKRIQKSLFPDERRRTSHGGITGRGKRKVRRPIDLRKPLHVVFRSSLAKGNLSFHRHARFIEWLIAQESRKWKLRVLQQSVNSNHLHFVVQGRDRHSIQSWLRVFPGRLAMRVAGSAKTRPGKFWDQIVFTRILEWGKELFAVRRYVIQNDLETWGLVSFEPRRRRKDTC